MIKDSTTTGPPSTSSRSTTWVLGCFGCSGQKMKLTDEKVNSGSRRRRWFSKWSFRCKKSAAKTVPVDLTTVPRKSKSVNFPPASSNTTWEIQVVEDVDDATLTKKHETWTDSVKRQNGPSYRSRRKETKAAVIKVSGAGGGHSPRKKTVTISHSLVSSPLKPLTHSTSLPPPKKTKPPPRVDGGVPHKTTPSGREFDSIVGMSIILVTLVVMVLWGKLCAILCTSAWFFIAPRLGAGGSGEGPAAATAEERRPESKTDLDLESVEYKKKVVLEGLLQRNHRNVAGRL